MQSEPSFVTVVSRVLLFKKGLIVAAILGGSAVSVSAICLPFVTCLFVQERGDSGGHLRRMSCCS
jgi:hypothetical protein